MVVFLGGFIIPISFIKYKEQSDPFGLSTTSVV